MEEKLVDLSETIAGMQSGDYKERFVAEYHQVRTRKAKLDAFIARIKTAKEKGEPEPRHDCPVWVLESQSEAMAKYQAVLEIRAKDYEGIDLFAPKKNEAGKMTGDDLAHDIATRKNNYIFGKKVSEILDKVDFHNCKSEFFLCTSDVFHGLHTEEYIRLIDLERIKECGMMDYRVVHATDFPFVPDGWLLVVLPDRKHHFQSGGQSK